MTVARSSELPDPRLRFGIDNLPVSGDDRFRYDRDFMTMRRIGVMQDVPSGDKRRARGLRAAREHELQDATLAAERTTVTREIALAWLEVHYAERTVAELGALADELGRAADLAPAAVAAGRARPAEVFVATSAIELVRDRIADQRRIAARARASLAAYLSDALERPLGSAPDVTRLAVNPEILIDPLHRHPNFELLQRREALAQTELELERAAKTPDWSVELLYGQRAPAFANMVTVMVSMDLPLWGERRQDRDIAAKRSMVEQSRAAAENARRMHVAEVRGVLADWRSAGERLARFDARILPLARDRVDAAVAAYGSGRGDLAAVLDARRADTEARLARLQVDADRARAWASLNFIAPTGEKP